MKAGRLKFYHYGSMLEKMDLASTGDLPPSLNFNGQVLFLDWKHRDTTFTPTGQWVTYRAWIEIEVARGLHEQALGLMAEGMSLETEFIQLIASHNLVRAPRFTVEGQLEYQGHNFRLIHGIDGHWFERPEEALSARHDVVAGRLEDAGEPQKSQHAARRRAQQLFEQMPRVSSVSVAYRSDAFNVFRNTYLHQYGRLERLQKQIEQSAAPAE